MVSTKSALEANGSQQDSVVSRSKPGKVFRSEVTRHTPVQQGLNHLGLQHRNFQAKGGGRQGMYVILLFRDSSRHGMEPPAANLPRHLPRHTTESSTDLNGIPWNPNTNPNPIPNLGALDIGVPWRLS